MARDYATARAFRRALEDRLSKIAETEQVQVNRLRREVAFDRLLMRLFRTDAAPWVLKGGYALELRFRTARSTLDIDLTVSRVMADTAERATRVLREMLQEAAGRQKVPFAFNVGTTRIGENRLGEDLASFLRDRSLACCC